MFEHEPCPLPPRITGQPKQPIEFGGLGQPRIPEACIYCVVFANTFDDAVTVFKCGPDEQETNAAAGRYQYRTIQVVDAQKRRLKIIEGDEDAITGYEMSIDRLYEAEFTCPFATKK